MSDLDSGLLTCKCSACGRLFTSRSAFDAHQSLRTGDIRCLPVEDMPDRFRIARTGPRGQSIWARHDPRGPVRWWDAQRRQTVLDGEQSESAAAEDEGYLSD